MRAQPVAPSHNRRIVASLPFVEALARRMAASMPNSVDVGDLVQDGVLGLIDASLGRKEEALREGRRAIELLPVEKDSTAGSQMLVYFAMIAAWAGEKDTALQYLAANAQSSGGFQVTTYGALKLLPFWDPLRDDPRFEQIVAFFGLKE